jgi:hypothetical protein
MRTFNDTTRPVLYPTMSYILLREIKQSAFVQAIAHKCIHSVVQAVLTAHGRKIPTVSALEQIATKYEHQSFVFSAQQYAQAGQMLETCQAICRALLQQSVLYQTHKKQFKALYQSPTFQCQLRDTHYRIELTKGRRFTTRQHHMLFTHWWHLMHPGQTLLDQLNQQLHTTDETSPFVQLYATLQLILTPTILNQEASAYQTHLTGFLDLLHTHNVGT